MIIQSRTLSGLGMRNPPKASYIICATPRSGSTLLCDALSRTRLAGRPDEYFLFWYWSVHKPQNMNRREARSWALPPASYVKKVFTRGTRGKVFGVKIMFSYFAFVVEVLRQYVDGENPRPENVLDSFFPNLHYIYITRQDKVRQAVSLARAVQTDEWKVNAWSDFVRLCERIFSRKNSQDNYLIYDFDQIDGFYREMVRQEESWENYFRESEIQPYRVVYESFVKSYNETLLEILKYLQVAHPAKMNFRKPFVKPQNDRLNEEWAQRFTADRSKQLLSFMGRQ
jgi:trehalose 2-sulfotransferase